MTWAPAYLTLNEFKSYKRIELTDTTDDAELNFAIESASRAIDQATYRQFGQVAAVETREYTAIFDTRRCRWIIEIDDLMDNAGLTINADLDKDFTFTDPIDSFRLFPFNAADKARPWILIIVNPDSINLPISAEGNIQINAKWGWLTVPNTIKEATLIQADRFFTRRVAPFGVAGSPEIGSEVRLLAKVDADVNVMLRSYKRWWGAV